MVVVALAAAVVEQGLTAVQGMASHCLESKDWWGGYCHGLWERNEMVVVALAAAVVEQGLTAVMASNAVESKDWQWGYCHSLLGSGSVPATCNYLTAYPPEIVMVPVGYQ